VKKQQVGFTLIELAIVLVIIGLLLGGVLKGQELINSAKVKNMAADFKNMPLYIYGYQDKFKALPGDDAAAVAHVAATAAGDSNGKIEGAWNSSVVAEESARFWEHVRLAGLAPGSTIITGASATSGFFPTNADGGRIGVSSAQPIAALSGIYFMCSAGILGKYAKQLDISLDDGFPNTGALRATTATTFAVAIPETAAIAWVDTDSYTVCMGI
jgi:prepilin-type N-terminal cleavage/methylation domain-containing protein